MLFYTPDFISIEHIGESDKPINCIFISKGALEQKNTYIVREATFTVLKKLISISKSQENNKTPGTFKLRICENNNIQSFNLDRVNSVQLFERLITNLKDESDYQNLISELEYMKKRIGY